MTLSHQTTVNTRDSISNLRISKHQILNEVVGKLSILTQKGAEYNQSDVFFGCDYRMFRAVSFKSQLKVELSVPSNTNYVK